MTKVNQISADDVGYFTAHCTAASNALDMYQQIAIKSAIYPGKQTPLGLVYTALKLNGEAGEFAEHVGKSMRDDALLITYGEYQADPKASTEVLTLERREALLKELGDMLWYISAASVELGSSLSEVARMNLGKLASRSSRGKLQGSGDNR